MAPVVRKAGYANCQLVITFDLYYYIEQREEENVGTIVFLILRFIFGINYYGDGQTLATLISLDSIALVLFLKLKKH
jgi:hypothetical protein